MPHRRGSFAALVALLALVCIAGTARAQSTSEQMLAQSLFDEARVLMDAGRYAEACPKLAESQRLDPGGGTLLNLAICHEKEGKVGTAYLEMTSASSQAARDGRKDREKIANEHLAALAPRVPKLAVHVGREEPGLEIRVDGTLLRKPAWDVLAAVDPGAHVVDAAAPGRAPFRTTVALAEGEQRTVQIPPLHVAAGSVASAEPAADPAAAPKKRNNPLFVASLVTGVVGFTVALPAALVWTQLKLTESSCKTVESSFLCTSAGVRDAWLATALVGLTVGVVGMIGVLALPSKIEVAAAPTAGGGVATVVGRF